VYYKHKGVSDIMLAHELQTCRSGKSKHYSPGTNGSQVHNPADLLSRKHRTKSGGSGGPPFFCFSFLFVPYLFTFSSCSLCCL